MPKYKIADIVFEAKFSHAYTEKRCQKYLCVEDLPSTTSLEVTKDDIERERRLGPAEDFPDAYLESLALYRKFLDYALSNQTIIIHCSALAVDGQAYLFLAPSGTGKSTHARLWREVFKDKVVMVNDDKPVIRKIDNEFFVYGTPWNGKHNIDNNVKVKIKAICILKRGEHNIVNKILPKDILMPLLNQTMRPKTANEADQLLGILGELIESVELYEMYCNISHEAAILAYETMSKKD